MAIITEQIKKELEEKEAVELRRKANILDNRLKGKAQQYSSVEYRLLGGRGLIIYTRNIK